ncbi:hypothetical protein PCANC_02192 [Puccinia coronata f. sp. avenae]|uniref:Uncharacterized protein n=1 Tax=Puccinia coronata f. sp. avenae TaxID=200324 RepID=A0A2N5W0R5_9BASI|nr:hypothetical protein PCANC_02192 [Puccinia coronata f. sp. avenae]
MELEFESIIYQDAMTDSAVDLIQRFLDRPLTSEEEARAKSMSIDRNQATRPPARTEEEKKNDPLQQEIVVEGYSLDYQNADEIVAPILRNLSRLSQQWSSPKYLAPYTSLIGPSMIGKTRLLMELSKHVCVIYICLRPTTSTGYPPRSSLADLILKDKIDFIELSTAIFDAVTAFFTKQDKTINAQDRLKEWNDYCKPPAEQFAKDVHSKMVGPKIRSLTRPVQALLKATQFVAKSGLKVLLAIDEARELLVQKPSSEVSPFRHWRRALATVPSKCGFFAIMTDTTSQVSNFSPSLKNDPSARPTVGENKLFAPIYNIATIDVLCNNRSPATWENLLAKERLFSYGCPFFGTYIQCARKTHDVERIVEELITTAEAKLLCRSSIELGANELTEGRIFALLGSTIQPQLYPASKLNSELVSSHVAHCLYIDQVRERIVADYPSQFAFSAAANGFLASDEARWVTCIEQLAVVLRQGLISSGNAGELASRIILLLAMQQTMRKVVLPPEDNTESIDYIYSVPLVDFLTTLTGLEADKINLGAISKENRYTLLTEGHIFWNHFINITFTPGPDDFMQFLYRGLAVQCKPNQVGFDQLFSIYLKRESNPELNKDDITFCGVQVKNAKSNVNLKKEGPKWTDKSGKININALNPYLVILIDCHGTIQENKIPTSDESHRRGTLLLFGLSQISCLTTAITEALETLLAIDPDIASFSNDPEIEKYVKSVLPCAYPTRISDQKILQKRTFDSTRSQASNAKGKGVQQNLDDKSDVMLGSESSGDHGQNETAKTKTQGNIKTSKRTGNKSKKQRGRLFPQKK